MISVSGLFNLLLSFLSISLVSWTRFSKWYFFRGAISRPQLYLYLSIVFNIVSGRRYNDSAFVHGSSQMFNSQLSNISIQLQHCYSVLALIYQYVFSAYIAIFLPCKHFSGFSLDCWSFFFCINMVVCPCDMFATCNTCALVVIGRVSLPCICFFCLKICICMFAMHSMRVWRTAQAP